MQRREIRVFKTAAICADAKIINVSGNNESRF
jgi:hypothetical protein